MNGGRAIAESAFMGLIRVGRFNGEGEGRGH